MERIKAISKKLVKLCLLLGLLLGVLSGTGVKTEAADHIIEIKSFEDLFIFAQASQSYDYAGQTVVLMNDININELDSEGIVGSEMLEKYGISHLTIGTKDRPFKGTFDGGGHTITGLTYEPNIIKDANSGLFSFIENATIKNIVLEKADIECIFQGGIIAGHAQNSRFENITVLDSKIKISPANNVVSLVTNGGFSGGGIVGIMEDSVMYNCEISGTEIANNTTSGVTGVGGEGLYMGGLVGWASGSTIEYSRVRASYPDEGTLSTDAKQSVVRNDYDVVVGALGGKSVYAGGIVGGVNNGTNIIDCYSTAEVSFYAANYIAVGSGIAGYAGGITGALRGNSTISRCHYAGDIHSRQYNAILVIPIIQNDVNINGLTRIIESDEGANVSNSYFKRSASKTTKELVAVNDWAESDSYSAKSDETYIDRNFWESKGYDFIGNQNRGQVDPESFNKWVMDYDLGIPVHGLSASATFDFPGAGKVSISRTDLVNGEVSTVDAYNFAVQGVHPRENPKQITLKAEAYNESGDTENPDYKFEGWYRVRDYKSDYVESIAALNEYTHGENADKVADQSDYTTPKPSETGDNSEEIVADNDLYIACMKARVRFHNLDGTLIDNPGVKYYTYEQMLADVKPADTPEGAKFYGWTTIAKDGGEGYEGISYNELESIQSQGELYNAGTPVTKYLDLYPIYTNYVSNIKTVFEGHEQDNVDNVAARYEPGKNLNENPQLYGSASTVSDSDGNVFIQVSGTDTDENGNPVFPDGYEFIGWYQKLEGGTDSADKTNEILVSKDTKYQIQDVSREVTYIARFKYRVDYNLKSYHQANNYPDSEIVNPYRTQWETYNSAFDDSIDVTFIRENVVHWGFGGSVDHTDGGSEACATICNSSYKIVAPLQVYSHNNFWGEGASTGYSVVAYTDFPGSGQISNEQRNNGVKLFYSPKSSYTYNFKFWTLERESVINWKDNYRDNPFEQTLINNRHYGVAHVTANITFHLKKSDSPITVERRYNNNYFMETDFEHKYNYPVLNQNDPVEDGKTQRSVLLKASPTNDSMQIEGYHFLGWINENEVGKDSSEWNYIYDVQDDLYCTSDIEKVKPYLMPADAKVTEATELYPVYAKYNIKTTSNIHEMAITTGLPDGINVTSLPEAVYVPKGDGTATVTVTAKTGVEKVKTDDTDTTMYQLEEMLCIADGKITEMSMKSGPDENGICTYEATITAGKEYLFMAVYNPVFVVYHLGDGNTVVEIRNRGDQLGAAPNPTYPNDISYFTGWTKENPGTENNYWMDVEKPMVTPQTIVNDTMDLWPVFKTITATCDSNIDTVITTAGQNPADYRSISRDKDGNFSLVAKGYPGYVFTGWNTGYNDEADQGTQITESPDYQLSEEQIFAGTKYTAIYKKSLEIRYHDLDGNIIYTANVISGERSFVTIFEKPDGTTAEVPIDGDAFVAIQKVLADNQRFEQWQWKNGDAYIDWKDFKDKTINDAWIQEWTDKERMDLYPVVYNFTSQDAEGNSYDNKMTFSIQKKENNYVFHAVFHEDYTQNKLTLNVTKLTWNTKDNPESVVGIDTNVYYAQVDEDGDHYLASGPIKTDESGNAVHTFRSILKLTKQYRTDTGEIDTSVNGIVVVIITDSEGNRITVPMTVEKGAAVVTYGLEPGEYTISEDEKWSWRDTKQTIEVLNRTDGEWVKSEKVTLAAGNPAEARIINQRTTSSWLSSIIRAKNKFQ